MHGLTRASATLISAGASGLLIWLATQINGGDRGGFWAVYGLIAGAGLVMALSQLLGGWTKWGRPHLSVSFLLSAFVPIAVVSLWIILAAEPGDAWFHRHVLSWSSSIHIDGLVNDLKEYVPLFAFGIGLVFGYSFDTRGRRSTTEAEGGGVADEPLTRDRTAAEGDMPVEDPDGVPTS